MKPISTYVTAAALVISGAAFVGCERDETATTTTTTTTTTQTPTGTRPTADGVDRAMDNTKDAASRAVDAAGDAAQSAGTAIKSGAAKVSGAAQDLVNPSPDRVPGVLGEVAEAALTKDGLDDIVERFVDADRNRIGNADLNSGNDALNTLVASIAKDWQAKYNTAFDIQNVETVYGSKFMTVQAGELGKNAAGTDVDIDVDRNVQPGGKTRVNVDTDPKSGVDSPDSKSADANRNDPGRNVATINIAASQGGQALQVPLIHEAGGWKIDVPDSLDAAKLRSNLVAHLTAVQGMKAQWPATADEAYQAVTRHVLMAVMDKPAK